jgi:transcriptional regulator with XRE-family HTH domain
MRFVDRVNIMATRKVELGPVGEYVRATIRATRRGRNLTLDDLAKRLALRSHVLSKAVLSQIETGGRRVDVDDLVAIARELGLTPGDLLPDEERTPLTPRQALDLVVRASRGEVINPSVMERAVEILANEVDDG